jgi:iron complex transport system substrate-binding protein
VKSAGTSRAPRRVAGVLTALVLAATAACGGGSTGGSSSQPTRTVTDVEGTEVAVPVDPQRVVTLSEPTLDAVLALGVEPIGTVAGRGQSTAPAYLADRAGDLPVLGGVAQPNYEAIGKARPDLILVDGTSINNNADAMTALRQIAPTVYTGYAGGSWRSNFTLVAEALNLADEGKAVVADYDAHVAEVKKGLGDYAGKTFSIVRWQGGSASLILKELPPGAALTDLGLARPANQDKNGRGHSEPVSLENLQDIDADYLFFGTLGGSSVDNPQAGGVADSAAADKALASALDAPGFTQLKAYRDDHVIAVDGSAWTSTGGPILMNRIIDDVQKALVK